MRITGIVFVCVFTLLYFFQNRYHAFQFEPKPIAVRVDVDAEHHELVLAPYTTMQDVIQTLKLDMELYVASIQPNQPLKDGDHIQIRTREVKPCISINNSTQEELETLPGIGPALAQRIYEYRMYHGSFLRLENIMEVQGIKDRLFEKIQPFICI